MVSRKRAKRRDPDLDAVLKAAVDQLLENGEGGFRIESIIEVTGISKSSLYLHFGDRDGLIIAASVHIFASESERNLAHASALFSQVTTKTEMRELLSALVDEVCNLPQTTRWNRTMILAASRHRARLHDQITRAVTDSNDEFTRAFEVLKNRGLLRAGLEPRECIQIIQMLTFGRVLRDLDNHRLDNDSWRRMFEFLLLSFVADD